MIAPGRLIGGGRRAEQDIADLVLIHGGQELAVVEAGKRSLEATAGLGQAKRYAQRFQARFAFATNGNDIYRVDMHTGEEGRSMPSPHPMSCGPRRSTPRTPGARVPYGRRSPVLNESIRIAGA